VTCCLECVTIRSRGLATSGSSCRASLYSRCLTHSSLARKETPESTRCTEWIGSAVTRDRVLGQVDRHEPPTGQLKTSLLGSTYHRCPAIRPTIPPRALPVPPVIRSSSINANGYTDDISETATSSRTACRDCEEAKEGNLHGGVRPTPSIGLGVE
jgi:hypothetical protein